MTRLRRGSGSTYLIKDTIAATARRKQANPDERQAALERAVRKLLA